MGEGDGWHFNIYKQDKYIIWESKSKKTPLFVSILVFMSSWNSMISWVEHEKSFITSGPVCLRDLRPGKAQTSLFSYRC